MVKSVRDLCVRTPKNIDEKEDCSFLRRICRKSRKGAVFQRIREVFARWRSVRVSVLQSEVCTEENTTTLDPSVALRPQDDGSAANVILSEAKDPVEGFPLLSSLCAYRRLFHLRLPHSLCRLFLVVVTSLQKAYKDVVRSIVRERRNTTTLDPSVALRPQDDEGAANVILSEAKDPVGRFPLAFPHLSALWRYLRLFFRYQRPRHYLLHSSSRGAAILIMVACFLPVILVGIKYSEKLFHSKDQELKKTSTAEIKKRCAREAALAVARNWNPGLTLAQQQDAIYKVADAVYNASPSHQSSIMGQAIPGLNFSSVPDKQISYNTSVKHRYMYHTEKWTPGPWQGHYVLWLGIDKMSAPAKRVSIFDEVQQDGANFSLLHQDLFIDPHTLAVVNDIDQTTVYYTPTSDASGVGNYFFADTLINSSYTASINSEASRSKNSFASQGAADLPDETHTTRVAPSAGGDLVVKVEVADDKIKATTDDQSGYAVPAECNVDIVLAVPTNGAACNVNNRDMASDTAESCFVSTSTVDNGRIWVLPTTVASGKQSPKDTPIYQMGQALKTFVKSHFYHTRGVNMALIPYSAKVSVSPDRATDWTVAFPAFVDTSANTQLMIGACLYGTSGVKGDALKQSAKTESRMSGDTLRTTDTPYYWGDIITACPIMFRAGAQQKETKYGGNSYYRGYLANYSQSGSALSAANTDPSKGASYKYLRMNYNPCYVGYANMLTMKCDKNCDSFVANPYYMIEPTADLVKIYEMCNALYPIYDTKNVSNFIFVPLEWAYNMFQSWTGNTNCATKSGSGRNSAGVDDGATLSRPSKTASGRKKAVILLVNKPDWFEPGEMTYLGFNNDKSEVPTVLSDKIDFSIDYTDTKKTYLDGSSYNTNHTSGDYSGINNTAFIAAGANKIIRCTVSSGSVDRNSNVGYYTSEGPSKVRFTFPRKGLFQIKVAPFGSIQFFKTNGLEENIDTYYIDGTRTFSFSGSKTGVTNAHTSGGANFGHNLSLYKVRYTTTNAFVSDATLTNQFLRDYIGQYGRGQSGYKPLILSTGALANRGNSSAPYCIAGTYGYVNTYHAGDPDFDNVVSYLPHFRDPCVHAYNPAHIQSHHTYGTEYHDDGYAPPNDQYYYFGGLTGRYTGYIYGGGTLKYDGITGTGNIAFRLTDTAPFALHKISATSWLLEVYIKSGLTKRLASTTIADYSKILEDNGGVYLMNLASNLNTSIVAGNYICFNGDGDLSVTATAKGTLRFTDGAENDKEAHTFTDEMIYTILPDDLNATANGEYYVDVELTGVKLISAEISNRPYTAEQVLKPKSLTYNDVEFIAGHQSGATLSWGARQITLPVTKNWVSVETVKGIKYIIKDCDTLPTGAIKSSGELTFQELSRGGSATLPSLADWRSVCYGGGKFVSVAYGSNIAAYSTTGTDTWSAATLPSSIKWVSVCYGGDKFVSVAYDSNKAAYSTTGTGTWSAATLPFSVYWHSVCYGGGKFVSVAYDSNQAAYSTTGTGTWSAATLPSTADWYSVCYGGGKFVSVADNSDQAAYSTTGTGTWSAATLPSSADWRSVCYGGGKFVSVAYKSDQAAYSTTGTGTWSAATLPSSVRWRSVCYGGGKFVSVADNSDKAAYSTDGINWLGSDCQLSFTQKGKISITTTGSGTLTFNSGVTGTESERKYSVSGTSTTTINASRLTGRSLTYFLSDGVLTKEVKLTDDTATSSQTVTTTTKSTIAGCNNLSTTESATVGHLSYKELSRGGSATLPYSNNWYSVCYGDGKFVSVAYNSNKAAYSTKGTGTWSAATLHSTGWNSVCYGGDKFVSVAESSKIAAYSTDGINWGGAILPSSTYWNSVCYGGDKFVSVAYNSNKAAYSTDGINWTAATLPSSAGWNSVCYGGGKFVSVAYNKAAYSTDGINWTAATLPSSASWLSVCYGGGKFVSVAYNKAAYSTDGINWTAATLPTLPSSAYWHSVCYGGGKFVSVAYNSYKAAYSTDGINWLESDCQLSFTQKGKISITTTGSGTLTFKSGVTGTASYSVSGTKTTEIEASRLSGSSLTYFLSDGVYTTKVELTNETSETVSPSQETVDTTVTVNVTDTTDKLCLRSTSNIALTWAIADSDGTITKANITPTSFDNGRYYYDVTDGYTPKYAMRSAGTITEEAYDLLDFVNTDSPVNKNGVLGVSGLSGTNMDGLYTVESASRARITANKLGMIELVVVPSMTAANGGTIRLLHGSDTAQKTITEKTTIRIPANDMQMDRTAPSATYYMDFDCTNLVILRAKFMQWQPIFSKPTVPTLSSVIDYSQTSGGKPSYNSGLVFTQQVNATYDGKLGYWRLTGGSHCIVDMQKYAKNDLFFFTEEYNPTGAGVAKSIWYGDGTRKSYANRVTRYLPGMVGMFFKGTEYWPGFGHGGSGNHKMIYAGCTQPINAALYNYAKGTTTANTADFNRTILKALTTAACAKLNEDPKSDVRVYVVKYRKQKRYNSISSSVVSGYSDTWTDTPTDHSYTEIDDCARTTGGTAYDVTTEADLKTTLDDIATKIKSWAEYSEAKNVIAE